MSEAVAPLQQQKPVQRKPRFFYTQEQLNQVGDAMARFISQSGYEGYEEVAQLLRSEPDNKVFRDNDLTGKKVRNIWINHFAPKFNRGPATDEEKIILGYAKQSGSHIVLTTILPNRTGQWVANLLASPRFLQWYNDNRSIYTNPKIVHSSTESVGRSGVVFRESQANEPPQPASQETFNQYLEYKEKFGDDGEEFNTGIALVLDPVDSDYITLSESVARSNSDDSSPFMLPSPSIPHPDLGVGDPWYDNYLSSKSVSPRQGRQGGGNRMKSSKKARKSARKAIKSSYRKARKSARKARKSSFRKVKGSSRK